MMRTFVGIKAVGGAGMASMLRIEAATIGEAIAIAEAKFASKDIIVTTGGELVRAVHDLLIGGRAATPDAVTHPAAPSGV